MSRYDAVILAGGAARRLGGVDKVSLRLGDRTLLERVVDAVADAATVTVVGPRRDLGARRVLWAREEPPGGGPVPALAAGLAPGSQPVVAVLAGDLPFLTPAAVAALTGALRPADGGALLVDGEGRDQLLAGVWRRAALAGALAGAGPLAGVPLRRVLAGISARRVALPGTGAGPPAWLDCDTESDLDLARRWA